VATNINDTGSSSLVVFDVVNPSIEITYPEGGESFESSSYFTPLCNAYDNYLSERPITIYLSESSGSPYQLLASNQIYNDSLFIQLPDINSDTVTLKAIISDLYGNSAEDVSNAFTVGTPEEDFDLEQFSINDSGSSGLVIFDVVHPEISITYPDGGETFEQGATITPTFDIYEDYLSDNPLTIYLSEISGGEYSIYLENASENDATIILPSINSDEVTLKVRISDLYGNSSEAISNSFIVGSQEEEFLLEQFEINDTGSSALTIFDVVDPTISVDYPNGGELINNYGDCNISCPAYDDYLSNESLSIEVSFVLGGWFAEVESGISPTYSSDYNIDLSAGGEIPESIYGIMRATVTDDYGNTSSDMSNGYFILGEPEGDIGINWLDEEELKVVVDWGWIENHDITLTDEAISNIQNFDNLIVYDDNGIHTESCENEVSSGYVELKTLNISDLSEDVPITLDHGFDYCELGGSRIVGYNPGNEIKFMVNNNGEDTFYSLSPTDDNHITQQLAFSSTMTIIDNFVFSDQQFTIPDYTPQLSIDNRDFDGFSIYNKITSIRDCDVDGTGENVGWCYDGEIQGATNYVSQLPAMQEASNVKYRVWLLDNNGVEILKTLDTSGLDYTDIDLSDIYDKPLAFGWNWFSLNMSADDMGINTILFSLDDAATYIKGQSGYADYYITDNFVGWNGTLNDFDNLSMYKINLTGSSGNIIYTGNTITPSTFPIPINSGWNWISYIPTESIDINTALASIGSNGTYIKSQSGYAEYYETDNFVGWAGTADMDNLNPKDGYMLNASGGTTLTYPDAGSLSRNMDSQDRVEPYWSFNYRDYQHNGSVTISIDDFAIEEGDQIGAFYNNECRGVGFAKEYTFSNNIAFQTMLYGDEGYMNMNFKLYDASENKEYDLEETILYHPNIRLNSILEPFIMSKLNTNLLKLDNPYPNPFNPVTTISYNIPIDMAKVDINVYDISGRLLENLHNGIQSQGNHKVVWDASNFSSGIYFVKLQTNSNTITKKLILIK